jgi:hypothetical protein
MIELDTAERRLVAAVLARIRQKRALNEKLVAVAASLTEHFADGCLVDRCDGECIERLAAVHADPSREAFIAAVPMRYTPTPNHPIMTVIRRRRAVFEPVVSDRTLRRIAHDEVHLAMLRRNGPTSAIRLPITTRGTIVAVVTLVITGHRRTVSPRVFSARDFEVAKAIARHVSAELSRPAEARGRVGSDA